MEKPIEYAFNSEDYNPDDQLLQFNERINNSKSTIFVLLEDYTSMDEDYSNKIIIFDDGSLVVQQMKTYCYEPQYSNFDFPKNEFFLDKIISLYTSKENEINNISFDEIHNNFHYTFKIRDKVFSLNFLSRWSEYKYDGSKNERTEVSIIEDNIIDLFCSLQEIIESLYPKIIDWERIKIK